MRLESHRNLVVWQKAVARVVECYRISKTFPSEERFGLTQPMRRAAVSVPANIAEGKGRGRPAEFVRFLEIANGSLTELDTHLVVACESGFIENETLTRVVCRLEEVGRMLTGLRKSLVPSS